MMNLSQELLSLGYFRFYLSILSQRLFVFTLSCCANVKYHFWRWMKTNERGNLLFFWICTEKATDKLIFLFSKPHKEAVIHHFGLFLEKPMFQLVRAIHWVMKTFLGPLSFLNTLCKIAFWLWHFVTRIGNPKRTFIIKFYRLISLDVFWMVRKCPCNFNL